MSKIYATGEVMVLIKKNNFMMKLKYTNISPVIQM